MDEPAPLPLPPPPTRGGRTSHRPRRRIESVAAVATWVFGLLWLSAAYVATGGLAEYPVNVAIPCGDAVTDATAGDRLAFAVMALVFLAAGATMQLVADRRLPRTRAARRSVWVAATIAVVSLLPLFGGYANLVVPFYVGLTLRAGSAWNASIRWALVPIVVGLAVVSATYWIDASNCL